MDTTLNRLHPGERARVVALLRDSPTMRRLAENGLLPGTELTFVRRAPLKDPLQIRLRGYSLTLRAKDAASVRVMKLP